MNRLVSSLFAVLVGVGSPAVVQAQSAADFPTVEEVREEHQGGDELDTAARHAAAFTILMLEIKDTTGKHPWTIQDMPPDAQARYHEYAEARQDAYDLGGQSGMFKYYHDRGFTYEVKKPRLPPSKRALAVVARPLIAVGEMAADAGASVVDVSRVFGAIVFSVLAVIALLLQILRRVRISESKPNELRVGRRRYQLFTHTGEVTHYMKGHSVRTHVTSSGGYQGTTHSTAPTVSSYSTTHVHQNFWIRRANGKELELDLTDWSVSVHDGHIVSPIYAAKRGKDWGPLVGIHNHSTDETMYHDWALRKIVKVRAWPVLVVSLLSSAAAGAVMSQEEAKFVMALLSGIFWFALFHKWIGTRRRIKSAKRLICNVYIPTIEQDVEEVKHSRAVDLANQYARPVRST